LFVKPIFVVFNHTVAKKGKVEADIFISFYFHDAITNK